MAEDLHDLAPLYAVGALEPDEEQAFEAHLPDCERCRAELTRASDGVAALASAVAEDPPAGMREQVMARVDVESTSVTPLRSARLWQAVAAVAAAVALALGVAWVAARDDALRGNQISEVLAAPDTAAVEVADSPVGSLRFVYSPDLGRGVLTGADLAPVPGDRTYQLWLIDDDGPDSAGVFRPGPDGEAVVVVEGGVRAGVTLGLTVEPAGGSPQPTGEVLVAQPLG